MECYFWGGGNRLDEIGLKLGDLDIGEMDFYMGRNGLGKFIPKVGEMDVTLSLVFFR